MNVKFRILQIDPNEHSVVVRYYTDIVTEDYLATSKNADGSIIKTPDGYPERCRTDYNINIFNTSASEEDIMKQIYLASPRDWLAMHEDIINPKIDTSLKVLKKLHKKEKSFDPEKVIPKPGPLPNS